MKFAITKEQGKKLLLSILAIAGAIVLIAILILGLFRIATLSKPWFSSLFSRNNAPAQIAGGESSSALPAIKPIADIEPPAASNPPVAEEVRAPKTADLSVHILSVGVIHPISGDIIKRGPMSPNEQVAVRFTIANNGNNPTGPWYFMAQLPTMTPNNIYTSPIQASLAAGDGMENMLRFTYAIPGGVFTVSVDPMNQIDELNEGNNTASTNI